jgi:ABC-type amino acid transport substrate-binding protein
MGGAFRFWNPQPQVMSRRRSRRLRVRGILVLASVLLVASCQMRQTGSVPPLPAVPHAPAAGPSIAEIRAAGFLRIASDLSFPPMEFRDAGSPAGFDIDLGALLAAALGVRMEIHDTPLPVMRTRFPPGTDLVLSALVPGEVIGRESVPYYTMTQAILLPARAPAATPDALAGLRVAVAAGSPAEGFARSAGTLVRTLMPQQAIAAVTSGTAQAAIGDRPLLEAYAQSHPGWRVQTGPWLETPIVAVVRENAPDLAAFVSTVLTELRENGGLAQLRARWHL